MRACAAFLSFSDPAIVSNELERGGLERNKMMVAADYDEARSRILSYGGKIPVAVLYLRPSSEYASAARDLHQSLLIINPNVAIYYTVSTDSGSLAELEQFGPVKINTERVLPMSFGGESPLYRLGKELQEKYFLRERVH